MTIVKPNFFVIGAAKAGTTSLCELLGAHPDVFMCDPKEPGFFSLPTKYKLGYDWYASLFARERPLGDAMTVIPSHLDLRNVLTVFSGRVYSGTRLAGLLNLLGRERTLRRHRKSASGFSQAATGCRANRKNGEPWF